MGILFTRYTRIAIWIATFVVMAVLGSPDARSNMSAYQFSQGTTTFTSISSTGTMIMSPTQDDGVAAGYSIGFNFNLDGTSYSTFTVNSNGLLGLTNNSGMYYYTNSFPTSYGYPVITALWDDLYLSATGHGIWYQVTGTSPNRVLTVEWNTRHISSTAANYVLQVKLYESGGKIELIYGGGTAYTSQSATIGVSIASGNFASVTPGSPASVSFTTANNSVNSLPSNGTIYTFNLCQGNISLAGNTSEGGTTNMYNGDSLFVGRSLTMGSSVVYRPFTASVGNMPCVSSIGYTFAISGPNAADYAISPTTGTLTANTSVTPNVTFTPRGAGVRSATLTITDNQGLSRTYGLRASGVARISWNGNTSQGGTTAMADGDTLMQSIGVNRLNTGVFTPLTLRNFSTDLSATPATATFTIIDPSGQYSVSPVSASIGSGQSITPSVTFRPTGLGPQYARLVVTVDNETRTYILAATSKAPQLKFIAETAELANGDIVMFRTTACTGVDAVSIPVVITNFGMGDAVISGATILKVDTLNSLPIPSKPLLRDAQGNVVVDPAFQFSLSQGTAPVNHAQDIVWPLTIPAGQSRTIYLNFAGVLPSRPIARAFFWSDAQNLNNPDTTGASLVGTISFLIGPRVIGATLAGTKEGLPVKPLIFPNTKIGNTATGYVVLANAGLCELRIARKDLRITAGDVTEFQMLNALPHSGFNSATGDYVIQPQSTDTIFFSFTPSGRGGRRATLMVRTNDSTIYLPGINERGVKYVDLFGEGTTDLVGDNVYLGAVIVGDTLTGMVRITNPNLVPLAITQINFAGANAAEFGQDPARPWPALTYTVQSNGTLDLAVQFTTSGAPGRHQADMVLRSGSGVVGIIHITAEAGTRELTVTPSSLFDNVTIPAGKVIRRSVAITNTGTFEVKLSAPVLSGPDAGNYRLGKLPRPYIAPGSTEYLEVTFSPTATGSSSAQIDIISNATNSPSVVTLGGTATFMRQDDEGNGDNPPTSPAGVRAEPGGTISLD